MLQGCGIACGSWTSTAARRAPAAGWRPPRTCAPPCTRWPHSCGPAGWRLCSRLLMTVRRSVDAIGLACWHWNVQGNPYCACIRVCCAYQAQSCKEVLLTVCGVLLMCPRPAERQSCTLTMACRSGPAGAGGSSAGCGGPPRCAAAPVPRAANRQCQPHRHRGQHSAVSGGTCHSSGCRHSPLFQWR